MEVNLGNVKISRALVITFYIFSLMLPIPFGLLIIDPKSFLNIDIFKLLLISISITGCSILLHYIFTFACFGLVKIATIISAKNKENTTKDKASDLVNGPISVNTKVPKPTDDLVITPIINATKSNDTSLGESVLHITFALNNISFIIVVLNLLRLKYFLHVNPKDWIILSIKTYLLVSVIWYSTYIFLFLISIRIIRGVVRERKKKNKTYESLINMLIEHYKAQNNS
jgi:hypothetical protein